MAELNTNTSVVDYLKSTGKDSSFASRAKLAVEKGIVSDIGQYTGSSSQNTSLLGSLRSTTTPSSTPSSGSASSGSDVNSMINKNQENDFTLKTQEDEPNIRSSSKATQDIFENINNILTDGLEQPDLPSFADRYQELRTEGGLADLEAQLNTLDKEEADIQARLRVRTNAEEGKPVALNVIEGRVTEATRQERENLEFIQRQKNYVSNQIQSKTAVIETIMNLEKMDFEFAESRYQNQFEQRKSTISLGLQVQEYQDDLEKDKIENARANGEIFVDTLVKSGKTSTDITASQDAQLRRWGLETGLGSDFFFNMIDAVQAESDSEILTHVISEDKSTATILFKNGKTQTISTGIKDTGSSGGDVEGFDLAVEFSNQFVGTQDELKQELLRAKEAGDIDLGVTQINSIVGTYKRKFNEEEINSKAKDLVNEYFDPKFFDFNFTSADDLKVAKRKAKDGIDEYKEDSSIDGVALSDGDVERLKEAINNITIDQINQ